MNGDLVYLDYAATSAIRPRAVTDAVVAYMNEVGGSPGRGSHRLAAEAGRTALRCRQALARLFRLPGDPGRLAFMYNATHALNTALSGLLGQGDVVVVTAFDHNAVMRTVHRLARERGVVVRMVAGFPDGSLDDDELDRALDGARVLVVNAVSNVLGTALPVTELAARARAAGAITVVDAAQAAGHLPLDVSSSGIDLLAFSGHKGLLAPQGIGGLWVREGVDVEPLLVGGTGGDSLQRSMPRAYPDHLEAGTQNGPGIAGLLAGTRFILERGVDDLHRRESELKRRLYDGLTAIDTVRVLSPPAPDGGAIVTFVADTMDPPTLVDRLDREWGVLARAGLHCAPDAHRILGTEQTGAVRFSLGWATTEEHIDRALAAVEAVTGRARSRTAVAGG